MILKRFLLKLWGISYILSTGIARTEDPKNLPVQKTHVRPVLKNMVKSSLPVIFEENKSNMLVVLRGYFSVRKMYWWCLQTPVEKMRLFGPCIQLLFPLLCWSLRRLLPFSFFRLQRVFKAWRIFRRRLVICKALYFYQIVWKIWRETSDFTVQKTPVRPISKMAVIVMGLLNGQYLYSKLPPVSQVFTK